MEDSERLTPLGRIRWALEMVKVHPHMWSHQAQGTPISILSEVAQEKLDKLEPIVEKLMQV